MAFRGNVEISMGLLPKITSNAILALGLLVLSWQAMAQPANKSTPSATPAPAPGMISSPNPTPDHTTATFDDWTLRCDRRLDITPSRRICELGLMVQKPGESGVQAQMAIGRVSRGEPLRFTAVLPPNVGLKTRPRLVVEGQEGASADLSWTRCIAGGCFADAELSTAALAILRSRTEPGRLNYRDGTERESTISISFRGLAAALDALAREEEN